MTINHSLIGLDESDRWADAISSIPHTHAHTHWYNKAMQIATGYETALYVGERGTFKIICPISFRKKQASDPADIVTPYGFSGLTSTGEDIHFADEWLKFLKSKNIVCGYIGLHPLLKKDSFALPSQLTYGKNTYFLELKNKTLDEILKGFSKSHHSLKQWLREGIEISSSKNEAHLNAFYNLYRQSLSEKNAHQVYYFGENALNTLLQSEYVHLLSVAINDEIIAMAIFILYNRHADYFLNATTHAGKYHTRGLIWHGIKLCKDLDIDHLHLGGGVVPHDSLEAFKSRFGAKAYPTSALKQIYDNELYQSLCDKYQKNITTTQYFPAYWGG